MRIANKKKQNLMVIGTMVYDVIINTFALRTLWGWLVVPFGLPPLTIVVAAVIPVLNAVFFILGLARNESMKSVSIEKALFKNTVKLTAKAFVFLSIGYIIQLFL